MAAREMKRKRRIKIKTTWGKRSAFMQHYFLEGEFLFYFVAVAVNGEQFTYIVFIFILFIYLHGNQKVIFLHLFTDRFCGDISPCFRIREELMLWILLAIPEHSSSVEFIYSINITLFYLFFLQSPAKTSICKPQRSKHQDQTSNLRIMNTNFSSPDTLHHWAIKNPNIRHMYSWPCQ